MPIYQSLQYLNISFFSRIINFSKLSLSIIICSRLQLQNCIHMQQTMVKALTEIISVDIGQNLVSMSVVQKQNQSGLKFNERLFIVVHGVFFGYLSKVKMNDSPNKLNIEEAKVKVPMKNLYSVEIADQIMTIKFTVQDNGKLVAKEWVLKAASAKMANFWKQLMEYELKIRKASPKKQSESPQKKGTEAANSQEKKQTKVANPPTLPVQEKKTQLKKNSRVFQNPLFDDGEPEEDQRPKRQSVRKSKVPQKVQPKKSEQIDSKLKKQAEVKPQPKIQNKAPQPKITQKPQIKVQPKSQIKVQKKTQVIAPHKKQLIVQLQLQKIEQQPVEQTPNIQSSKLSKTPKGFSKVNSPQKNRQSSKKQEERTSQKFDLGIKESQFINTVLHDLDDRNERYPIQQLTYKHEDVEKVYKLYGKNLNEAQNQHNKTEKLLNYIIQTQKKKMERSIAKIGVSDGSPWIYKQIILDEVSNLVSFKSKCMELMKELYCQIYNRQCTKFMKVKQQANIVYYQIEDIQVKVPQITFNKASSSTGINLLDKSAEKIVKKQFKYLQYLYRIMKNEDNIRVPLTCLCEYGGIIALFKAKCILGQKQSVMQNIDSIVNNLQAKSKLSLHAVLKDRIKPLKELYYNDLRQGDTSILFRYCMVIEPTNLFPCDLTSTKCSHDRQLRMELIQSQYKEKTVPYYSNEDIMNKSQAKILLSLAQILDQKINKMVSMLDEASFYFIHPQQLTHLLHSEGINMRHLKTIYQKLNVPYLKTLIASEMVSRSIKLLLRKTLQDQCFELLSKKQSKNKESELSQLMKEKCTDFLNCAFGVGAQTDAIWQLINKNYQEKYQMHLEAKSEINKGQLFVSVVHHCNISVDWKHIQITDMFSTEQFLKNDTIKELKVTAKSYEPIQSKLKTQVQSRMKEVLHQNFEYITQLLKLKTQKIPKELYLYENVVSQLKVYLANFIQPQQYDWNNSYSHLSIYDFGEPKLSTFKTQLCQLKWYLKTNKKQQYVNKFSEFSSKMAKIYGNNHPLLSEMYHIFAEHHKAKGEVEDSINFIKSSLLNYSALFGDQNVIVANSYYKLALLLIGYNRFYDAEQYLVKAKQIMDHVRSDRSVLDAKIRLSLAIIYFQDQKYKQSYELISNKLDLFEQQQADQGQTLENQRTQLYQLLYYCQAKQNARTECAKLCSHLQKKLIYFRQHGNFAQILCIIIDFYLNSLTPQSKQTMHKLIGMIPTKISIAYYKKAYELLMKRYNEKSLFGSFKKYSENAGKIVDMIVQKNLLKVWQNLQKVHERQTLFDFVSLVEELVYFLGRDRLYAI